MTEPSKRSWMEWIAGDTYGDMWRAVVRPSRHKYTMTELGPTSFTLGTRSYERRDLQLRNSAGHALECSHFVPAEALEERQPCVIYLHGNSSSRLEALSVLPTLLMLDVSVFCLDTSGSGLSEGQYISLGHQEEKDLCVVLRHLRRSGEVSSVGLWGRSMGAATAILRAAKDHCLAACILDSPFRDLRTVAEELVGQAITVPQFVLDMALETLRGEVCKHAGFDPDGVLPIKSAPQARCPALFAAARDDRFVLPHNTQDLYDAWGGDCLLRTFTGGHNGERPAWFMQEASHFLAMHLHNKAGGLRVLPLAGDSEGAVHQHVDAAARQHVEIPQLPFDVAPRAQPAQDLDKTVSLVESLAVRKTMRKAIQGAVRRLHVGRRARLNVRRRAVSEHHGTLRKRLTSLPLCSLRYCSLDDTSASFPPSLDSTLTEETLSRTMTAPVRRAPSKKTIEVEEGQDTCRRSI